MGSETWPMLIHLLLLSLGGGVLAQAAGDDSPKPAATLCKTSFLRGYKLKGVARANSTDPLLICPSVGSNCCSKRDQLYIYHYLRDVLPNHLNDFKMRRDSAFQRLKGLHKKIIATSPDFSKTGVEKANFCGTEWRKLTTFDIENLNRNYLAFTEAWEGNRRDSLETFFCTLCDGQNQQFLDEVEGTVTIKGGTCSSFVQNNKDAIRFWLGEFLTYVINLQNVVDCNHYSHAFNLTFFQPAQIKNRQSGLNCVRSAGGGKELSGDCRHLCSQIGLASFTPFVDGDPAFIEEVVNLFDKFNYNKESGRFISMEMRHYFKRFEPIKQLKPAEQREFRNIVAKSLEPVVSQINVVEALQRVIPVPRKMNLGFLRQRLATAQERRLGLGPSQSTPAPIDYEVIPENQPAFRPSNQNSEAVDFGILQKANEKFNEELQVSPLLLNGRRLQAADNSTSKPIRKPKIDIFWENQVIYDQIAMDTRGKNSPLIFPVMTVPLDMDKIPRKFSPEAGIETEYLVMDLEIDPKSFHQLLYKQRPPDTFNLKVESILESNPATLVQDLNAMFEEDTFINGDNYYVKSMPDVVGRKLNLVGVKATKLLKEITAKR